ncbi:MAG TPA: hydroxyacid dehydrogenase [Chloroflexi bacterium]|jgi:D-3-phosphoglycerate dehydrogenase|nr:hydroxyacid dehydrogenase [Anaerolineaceae bacterium]HHX07878.1 hydroxyacid dehydrogenase [Chloroflexota bacterium]
MAWKVLITDGLESIGKDLLNQAGVAVDKKGIDADQLLQEVGDYDGMIVRGRTKVTKEVFDAAKKLKVVGRAGVGVDNIDLEAAKEHGVTVVNCPVATSEAVAEHAVALLFALSREIPRADAAMKAGDWAKKSLMGLELKGKTLGIIGFGNIGRLVAKYASAMGMKVVVYKRTWDPEYVREKGAEQVHLDELLAKADFITLHLPLTPETKHLLSEDAFTKMKDGIYIVDASRGGVIDQAALLRALESGKVAGAAIDVFEKEPPVEWDLVKHKKVIATPHIGGQTIEAQTRAAEDISSEVINVLECKDLRWKIC